MLIKCESESWVNISYVLIWIMGEYDLCVNRNYGWIWFMSKSGLWVNMIYVLIWFMGEFDLCLNLNYGWGETDRQTHTHLHINTMTWLGLGAGPSEKIAQIVFHIKLSTLPQQLSQIQLNKKFNHYSHLIFSHFPCLPLLVY